MVRLLRIMFCNVHVWTSLGRNIQHVSAVVEYRQSSGMLRIQIPAITSALRPGPGQFYFLYQPLRWCGWESHPLTLAFWHGQDQGQVALSPFDGPRTTTVAHVDKSNNDCAGTTLEFWARPRSGWTKVLQEHCLTSPGLSFRSIILLEGPYQNAQPLHNFEQVIMLIGGSGITAALPYLLDHRSRTSDTQRRTPSSRHIHLVWVCRNEKFMRELIQQRLLFAAPRADLSFTLYSTGTTDAATVSSPSASDTEWKATTTEAYGPTQQPSTHQSGVFIHRGRPPIANLIKEVAIASQASRSTVAVFSCGPAGMMDASRAGTLECTRQVSVPIKYFEEGFN